VRRARARDGGWMARREGRHGADFQQVAQGTRAPGRRVLTRRAEPTWILAAVESASHCSGGEPAAERSPKLSPEDSMAQGQWTPLDWTTYPTKANMAMRPCLISAWRRKPIAASSPWLHWSYSQRFIGSLRGVAVMAPVSEAGRASRPRPGCPVGTGTGAARTRSQRRG
jgi:hypothetical protein